MATIQWFPGHMAKALRQIREQMPLVDILFELVDARVPYSSQNPEVALAAGEKPKLLIMTKTDLADQKRLNEWIKYFEQHNQPVLALDSRQNNVAKVVTAKSKEILKDKLAEEKAKGMKKRPIRAMCVGVPNVGKSTLLKIITGVVKPNSGTIHIDGKVSALLELGAGSSAGRAAALSGDERSGAGGDVRKRPPRRGEL